MNENMIPLIALLVMGVLLFCAGLLVGISIRCINLLCRKPSVYIVYYEEEEDSPPRLRKVTPFYGPIASSGPKAEEVLTKNGYEHITRDRYRAANIPRACAQLLIDDGAKLEHLRLEARGREPSDSWIPS